MPPNIFYVFEISMKHFGEFVNGHVKGFTLKGLINIGRNHFSSWFLLFFPTAPHQ